jgi:DNA-binding MarR family transcriptional regulator
MCSKEGSIMGHVHNPSEDIEAVFLLRNRLLFRLFKTTNLMHRVGTAWTADIDLTTQQWSVLGGLARSSSKDGLTVKELIKFLEMTRQNANGVIERLEREGLVERVKDTRDGRARLVRLTDKGWTVWSDLKLRISEFYGAALAGFSEEETTQFQHLLDRLRKNLIAAG